MSITKEQLFDSLDQIIIFGGLMKDNNSHSDQTLVLSLNYMEDKTNTNNSQVYSQLKQNHERFMTLFNKKENKMACTNCEIVYNLTEQQNEKQQQLNLELKNIQIDDEDNIRIDVDREKENSNKHLHIQNNFKSEDGGNDTEIEKNKSSQNNVSKIKPNNPNSQKLEDETDAENAVVSDKVSENDKKNAQNKNNMSISESQDKGISLNNQNGSNNDKKSKFNTKKDENDMDEEQYDDQGSIKDDSQQEDQKSAGKQDMYEFDVKEDSVLESEERLRQQERDAQRNKLKKELAAQHHPHHNHHQQHSEESILNIRQPYISMSFLNSISNLIGWPFAAFGLLVHNAKSQSATNIQINLMCQKKMETYVNNQVPNKIGESGSSSNLQENNNNSKVNGQILNQPIDKNIIDNYNLFFQFYDDSEGFSHNDFVDVLYKFDNYKTIQQNKQQKEMIQDETYQFQKAQYGNNIKLAGLRLGQNVLYISKNKTQGILNVGLISSNGKINPNLQECIIFLFSIDMKKKVYLTESGDQNKRIILNSVAHIMNEDQLFNHGKGNHIYIFDLKRIPSVNRESYEFSYNHTRPDIVTKKKTLFKEKKDQVERLIDFSLKSYIQHLYIKAPDNMHFSINGQKYEFVSYQEILRKQKELKSLQELNIDSYSMMKDTGKVTIYEQISQNNDKPASNQQQKDTSANVENKPNQPSGENKGDKQSIFYYQGILIYQDERLIGRAEANTFGSYFIDKILNKTVNLPTLFKYVGIIELDKFFKPNLFFTGLDNSFQEAAVRQSLKQFLKSQKQQKSDKIRVRSSENIEEPELRKEIKTD